MGKRIQKIPLKNLGSRTMDLGYVDENEHTQIIIECGEVFWDYPNATATMVVRPPVGNLYNATLTRDDNNIVWEITASDVVYAGGGQVQLTFTNNGEIVKSAIGATSISSSIKATGEAPVPLQSWLDEANTKITQLDALIARCEAVLGITGET